MKSSTVGRQEERRGGDRVRQEEWGESTTSRLAVPDQLLLGIGFSVIPNHNIYLS